MVVLEPNEVIHRAAAAGLDLIALDHDLPAYLSTERIEVNGRPIWLIAAAEISVSQDGHEYHMLAYFPGEVPAAFRAFCERQCQHRAERYEQVRTKLGEANIPQSDPAAHRGERSLTRLHMARALVDSGHAKSSTGLHELPQHGDRERPSDQPACDRNYPIHSVIGWTRQLGTPSLDGHKKSPTAIR